MPVVFGFQLIINQYLYTNKYYVITFFNPCWLIALLIGLLTFDLLTKQKKNSINIHQCRINVPNILIFIKSKFNLD